MYDQKVFRILIIITLFVALALYHLTNLLIPDYWTKSNDALVLLKLAQFALVTLSVLMAAYSNRFAQFVYTKLNRDDYFGGCYSGSSGDAGKQNETCFEVFTIKQSLFDISISGKTYAIKERIEWANWNGRAFKKEGNMVYFGITSLIPHNQLPRGNSEHAIMQITFDDRRNITGLTYSTSPTEDGRNRYWLRATWSDHQAAECFDTYRPSFITQSEILP